MSEEEKYYSNQGFFSWFDRILFFLIVACHFAAMCDFIREKIERHVTPELALLGYIILITVFWTVFISAFSWRQIREAQTLQKYKGYVFAYKWFNLAFSLSHQIQRELSEVPVDVNLSEDKVAIVILQFEEFCGHIASALRAITGKEVSVCIKLLVNKENGSLKTFVRDGASVDRNYNEDNLSHTIDENTSFAHIIKQIGRGKGTGKDGRYFFSNNLPQYKGYINSSFSFYNQETYKDELSKRQRKKMWKMPYKSTIVTGIYPNQKQYFRDQYIIGFLCIDSDFIEVFNESIDTAILTGISDGIYNSLKTFDILTR
jgi:hypothetical protein